MEDAACRVGFLPSGGVLNICKVSWTPKLRQEEAQNLKPLLIYTAYGQGKRLLVLLILGYCEPLVIARQTFIQPAAPAVECVCDPKQALFVYA